MLLLVICWWRLSCTGLHQATRCSHRICFVIRVNLHHGVHLDRGSRGYTTTTSTTRVSFVFNGRDLLLVVVAEFQYRHANCRGFLKHGESQQIWHTFLGLVQTYVCATCHCLPRAVAGINLSIATTAIRTHDRSSLPKTLHSCFNTKVAEINPTLVTHNLHVIYFIPEK